MTIEYGEVGVELRALVAYRRRRALRLLQDLRGHERRVLSGEGGHVPHDAPDDLYAIRHA